MTLIILLYQMGFCLNLTFSHLFYSIETLKQLLIFEWLILFFFLYRVQIFFPRLYEPFRLLGAKTISSSLLSIIGTLAPSLLQFLLIISWRCSSIFFVIFCLVFFVSSYMPLFLSAYFHWPPRFILVPLMNLTPSSLLYSWFSWALVLISHFCSVLLNMGPYVFQKLGLHDANLMCDQDSSWSKFYFDFNMLFEFKIKFYYLLIHFHSPYTCYLKKMYNIFYCIFFKFLMLINLKKF